MISRCSNLFIILELTDMTSFQRPNFLRIQNVLPDMSVPKFSFFYKGYKATLPNSLSESTSLKVAQMVTLWGNATF